jgi:hypothetical protein
MPKIAYLSSLRGKAYCGSKIKKNVDGKDIEEQVAYAIEYKTSLIEKKVL